VTATIPPSRSARAREVVAAAGDILEREGREALTMRRVADALGIQAPSLYKHFQNKAAVESALIDDGLLEMGEACHAAVRRGPATTTIARLLKTYRAWGLAHPNRYRLATSGRLDRAALTPGREEWAGTVFFIAAGEEPHLAQALWSFAHGTLILELDDRYADASDLDRTWAAGAAAFTAAASGAKALRSRQ
jgi:AcrR family transcriptional regulator